MLTMVMMPKPPKGGVAVKGETGKESPGEAAH
jgi:hypothetical protein